MRLMTQLEEGDLETTTLPHLSSVLHCLSLLPLPPVCNCVLCLRVGPCAPTPQSVPSSHHLLLVTLLSVLMAPSLPLLTETIPKYFGDCCDCLS